MPQKENLNLHTRNKILYVGILSCLFVTLTSVYKLRKKYNNNNQMSTLKIDDSQ